MRQKLEEKKKLKRDADHSQGGASQASSDARNVDELVRFIQGDEGEEGVLGRRKGGRNRQGR